MDENGLPTEPATSIINFEFLLVHSIFTIFSQYLKMNEHAVTSPKGDWFLKILNLLIFNI